MRVNINMDEPLLRRVDEAARKLYISRSAFLALSAAEKLQSTEMINAYIKLANDPDFKKDIVSKK